jgi:hypothetical protein
VKEWQKDYGNKKKALAIAAVKLQQAVNDQAYLAQLANDYKGNLMLEARQLFADVVSNFTSLHMNEVAGSYVGMLAGMKIVKDKIAKNKIEYHIPSDIIENLENLDGIKFYVLGPPLSWENVKLETGGKGESYQHNKEISGSDAFAAAILEYDANQINNNALPFDSTYDLDNGLALPTIIYNKLNNEWRKIDYDWLYSAGTLALRINSITNNLSLALAIEFEDSGKIMLFPGDAEYGSWASWHTINWNALSRDKNKHLTEDLLNRTVFYKVAHHLSHHGTAQRLGLEMMIHPELVSMATLDYTVISPSWKNTMPNRAIIKELLARTKGRLMIMNEEQLYYDFDNETPLTDIIEDAKNRMNNKEEMEFASNFIKEPMYLQYTVHG